MLTARGSVAEEHSVPVVPGTAAAVTSYDEAAAFCADCGFPVIIKAAFGGGGRGMRVVQSQSFLEENFKRATSEALQAFGDGSVFIERYVDSPRHIEVQILADGTDTVHLFERDCSVQRRHQKVVEVAPAIGLPSAVAQALYADAVRITSGAGYVNAGTVEFLVDPKTWRHYFIEVKRTPAARHTSASTSSQPRRRPRASL